MYTHVSTMHDAPPSNGYGVNYRGKMTDIILVIHTSHRELSSKLFPREVCSRAQTCVVHVHVHVLEPPLIISIVRNESCSFFFSFVSFFVLYFISRPSILSFLSRGIDTQYLRVDVSTYLLTFKMKWETEVNSITNFFQIQIESLNNVCTFV